MKTYVSKEKFACPRTIFEKTKNFAKPFSPVHMGPRLNLLIKKMAENLVTMFLSVFFSHCSSVRHNFYSIFPKN